MQIGYVFSRAAETPSRVSLGDGKKTHEFQGGLCFKAGTCQLIARLALGVAQSPRVDKI
jgi:hypothetical protein